MATVVRRRTAHALAWTLLIAWPAATRAQASAASASESVQQPDGQHDFDFELGSWKCHISRLLKPLTGSNAWAEYDGTSVVHRVWNGRANLGELDVSGPAGRIQGLSLRLYEPATRQWYIRWANAADGAMGAPMIGGFRNGRGEFYNQETLNGRAIYVRFIFSDITPTSFRLEQAFSGDGGTTWEPNWIATFAKVGDEPSSPR